MGGRASPGRGGGTARVAGAALAGARSSLGYLAVAQNRY